MTVGAGQEKQGDPPIVLFDLTVQFTSQELTAAPPPRRPQNASQIYEINLLSEYRGNKGSKAALTFGRSRNQVKGSEFSLRKAPWNTGEYFFKVACL